MKEKLKNQNRVKSRWVEYTYIYIPKGIPRGTWEMKLKVSIFVNYVTLMFYLKRYVLPVDQISPRRVQKTPKPRKIVADFHKHQIQ